MFYDSYVQNGRETYTILVHDETAAHMTRLRREAQRVERNARPALDRPRHKRRSRVSSISAILDTFADALLADASAAEECRALRHALAADSWRSTANETEALIGSPTL